MTKWEYTVVIRYANCPLWDGDLDRFGRHGWELVSVATIGQTAELHYIFKRQLQT